MLDGHHGAVNDCAVAPDESFIVSASSDRTLRIWDAETGSPVRTLAGHGAFVSGCAISPDARFVASASGDHTVKVWRMDDGECVTTLHVDAVLDDCVWTPDGRGVVAAGAAGVYFLELCVAGAEGFAVA